jgi:hypothetical protein
MTRAETPNQAEKEKGDRPWLPFIFTVIGLIVFVALIFWGIWADLHYHWTAYSRFTSPLTQDQFLERQKTLWDWMELLIVPLAIAFSLAGVGMAERRNERRIADERIKQDRAIADERVTQERELSESRAQEAAMEAYLEQMSTLLLDKNLGTSEPGDESRVIARVWTLTILRRLTGERKGVVVRFLYESELIQVGENKSGEMGPDVVISLANADLTHAILAHTNLANACLPQVNLMHGNLAQVNLTNAYFTNAILTSANLAGAILTNADLMSAILTNANLVGTIFTNAVLVRANLTNAVLVRAIFTNAVLVRAIFEHANLSDAILKNAHLGRANLTSANLTRAYLAGANLAYADLKNADLANVTLAGATYDARTRWPVGFDPDAAGAVFVPDSEQGDA